MTNYQNIETTPANLDEHRAVKAWAKLFPPSREPIRVVILKPEHKTSSVYRLEGLGPSGSAVIAKRKRIGSMAIELTIYREILPQTGLRTLECYGFLDDPDPGFGWLFLEDAGDRKFNFDDPEHRALAAEWFATLHGSAARYARAKDWLPSRGLKHWRKTVSRACETIQLSLANPAFSPDDLRILQAVLSYGQSVLLHWGRVEEIGKKMSETVVQGDFGPKKGGVGEDSDRLYLFPIDWDWAGWGVAAADLSHTDIAVYWSIVHRQWPSLQLAAVKKVANLGR